MIVQWIKNLWGPVNSPITKWDPINRIRRRLIHVSYLYSTPLLKWPANIAKLWNSMGLNVYELAPTQCCLCQWSKECANQCLPTVQWCCRITNIASSSLITASTIKLHQIVCASIWVWMQVALCLFWGARVHIIPTSKEMVLWLSKAFFRRFKEREWVGCTPFLVWSCCTVRRSNRVVKSSQVCTKHAYK